MPEKNARPNSYRGLASPFVRSGADFDQYLAVRLVLLSRQLKDSGSHQQQNREQQLIRFHIGRLVGHPYHSLKSPACSCISTTTKKPHDSENRAAFIGHYPRPSRLTTCRALFRLLLQHRPPTSVEVLGKKDQARCPCHTESAKIPWAPSPSVVFQKGLTFQ